MNNAYFQYPSPANEPVKGYAPGSPERAALKAAIAQLKAEEKDIPMIINGKEVRSSNTWTIYPPHELKHKLGQFHLGDKTHVKNAIDAALKAKKAWAAMSFEHRAAIFLKAAELIATKYRYLLNGATMLGQSKNPFQAEVDSACELIDFFRFNVHFLSEIYKQQPISDHTMDNRVEYRPLEGFVVAITPFNFTSIGGNLPTAPALCGNVVVWKPAYTQVYSAYILMQILMEAGLPNGVINLIYTEGPDLGDVCFNHPDFAGLHFTGSTKVFQQLWKEIGNNIEKYKTYPRIVGETGGKDFIFVHSSANTDAVVANIVRGAFEFQGQKCSAASRVYLPSNLSDEIIKKLKAEVATLKMGPVDDFTNFINAVIDERAFNKISSYIAGAATSEDAAIIAGGHYNKSEGYFIEPTVILAQKPDYVTMREEIFGPVVTLYVYKAEDWENILETVDSTSEYGLTGAVFAQDRHVIETLTEKLVNTAGNFYINDKPTGAVVGQQPFGGARGSGTNDKAGSAMNLYRWLSARTIKETYVPATDYRYTFHQEG